MNYNYVLYHSNCVDGFVSFLILEKSGRITNDAIIYADVPSTSSIPKNIEGKDVIILDLAYKYEVLREIFLSAKSVLFIDHHVTIHDDVLRLVDTIDNSKIKIIYDESHCGASLSWKYFNENKQLPLFVKYVRDNDLGKWELKHTHAFMACINVQYNMRLTKENIKKWNKLFDESVVKKTIKKGNIYREYVEYLLDKNVNRYSMLSFPSELLYEEFSDTFKKPNEFRVAVMTGACPDISMLGAKIMDEIDCDFVIFISLQLDRKQYVLSFRSNDNGADVGTIAKMFGFGGGGHRNASSTSIPMSKYRIEDMFGSNSLPRQRKY